MGTYDGDTDGNLASLRQHERECDAHDIAQESILGAIQPLLDDMQEKIQEMIDGIHGYDDYLEGYDFSEFISDCIKEDVLDNLEV